MTPCADNSINKLLQVCIFPKGMQEKLNKAQQICLEEEIKSLQRQLCQVKDDRNANGCVGSGTVTSQIDLCFPG